jgi:serine/threonine protein kinase
LKEKLGEGSFGVVYKAVHKAASFELAVKMIGCAGAQPTKEEADALQVCHSKNDPRTSLSFARADADIIPSPLSLCFTPSCMLDVMFLL